MNRIREVNVELGYAVIEPGVSQGQMYEYIRDNELPLILDVTGAGPDASIVGNILQRGFGHTPYGDRFRHTSGLEVVLPDGRLIRTGFGRYQNAQAAHVFPWGKGPWIDGLFTQSDYGIVTSACIWLMPKPEAIVGFALKIPSDDSLGKLIDALRRLRMRRTIESTVHVANDLRVLSSRSRYPWELCREGTTLSAKIRGELRQAHGVGAWNLVGGLYGAGAEVQAAKSVIRKEISRIARVHFFRRPTLARAKSVCHLLPSGRIRQRLESTVASVESVFDLLEGIPSREHLRGVQWRDQDAAQSIGDPRRSGLIWHSPVIPMTATAVERLLLIIESTFDECGLDPLITLSTVTDRSLCCVTSINFDKSDTSSTESAVRCRELLSERTSAEGYYPYRGATISREA
jgi:4-cresol dehydrogenase (hydroxylating)